MKTIPIDRLCLINRLDILFRAYVLEHNDYRAWGYFCSIPVNRKTDYGSLFDMRDSIKKIGQQIPVNITKIKGQFYPTMGAKRISSLLALDIKDIKVVEVPEEKGLKWNLVRNFHTEHLRDLSEEIKVQFKIWLKEHNITGMKSQKEIKTPFPRDLILKRYDAYLRKTEVRIHVDRYHSFCIDSTVCKAFYSAFRFFYGKNVLDVGCSVGFYGCVMSRFADNVIGIDRCEKSLKEANLLKDELHVNNITFIEMNAHKLTPEFLRKYKIKALFIHKTMSADSGWTPEVQNKFWDLMKNHMDVIVASATAFDSKKPDILRPVFAKDKRFKIIEIGQNLVVIKRV